MVLLIIFAIAFIISILWVGGIDSSKAEERKHKKANETITEFWGRFP